MIRTVTKTKSRSRTVKRTLTIEGDEARYAKSNRVLAKAIRPFLRSGEQILGIKIIEDTPTVKTVVTKGSGRTRRVHKVVGGIVYGANDREFPTAAAAIAFAKELSAKSPDAVLKVVDAVVRDGADTTVKTTVTKNKIKVEVEIGVPADTFDGFFFFGWAAS